MGKDTTTVKLTTTLRDHFCRTAAPDLLWSDGGPQFTSHQFANFLQTWGVTHITSSPHYPQSNGKVEATVKSMKKLISAAWTGHSVNWDQLPRALLQYRNTPCRKDGLSPAQKLFGHPVQDTLPAHRRSFAPEWQRSSQEADSAATHTQKHPRPPMINMPTLCPIFRLATVLQCRTLPPKCGISTEQSLPLDRTGAISSKPRVAAFSSGIDDSFAKEAPCQSLAPLPVCHLTPLNPVVLPTPPTGPFVYLRIQHGSSAPLSTHRSLVGRCKVMNSGLRTLTHYVSHAYLAILSELSLVGL